jgi:isoleucyl-tRNA synthetase
MTNDTPKTNADFYRETVFLPKTDFPMRAGLAKKEPEILKKWQDIDLYKQLREKSKGQDTWVLHDGPPYANGDIHMGHALNKILKDVVVKSYQMMGYNAPYVPGWDCHGLPIEWKIEEKYREAGKDKDDVDLLQFRDECRAFARKWVGIQSEQFKRLGVSGDWDNPYLTMTNRAESKIAEEIHKFAKNGLLYRGAKPVMWSVVEKTALAEAEIEYKEHKSVTIWVRFPVMETTLDLLKGADIVIWTTTPWTIPSNRALAFGADIEYGVYEYDGGKLAMATSLAENVKDAAKIENWTLLGTFKGSEAAGTIAAHPLRGTLDPSSLRKQGSSTAEARAEAIENWIPACAGMTADENAASSEGNTDTEGNTTPPPLLHCVKSNKGNNMPFDGLENEETIYNFPVPLLCGDFVTDDAGTGFVHIAPGHGEDDFNLVREHNMNCDRWTAEVRDDGKTINKEFLQEMSYDIKIEITDNVADDGVFREHVPLFAGLEIYTQKGELGGGNWAVLKALNEAGKLLCKGKLTHEYPHSWRSKAPLIFRTTPQWFIGMDRMFEVSPPPHLTSPQRGDRKENTLDSLLPSGGELEGGAMLCAHDTTNTAESTSASSDKILHNSILEDERKTLREKALSEISNTRWAPEKGKARITSMIENRPDWCISRQRAWGVPIALFVHKDTKEILTDETVLSRITEIFEKEGSDAWWAREAQDFLGSEYNADAYEQIFDIVDVWFESGSTHEFVVGDDQTWPDYTGVERADLYLEGSDQHRGWFHSSLLESVGTTGKAPYKTVLTHGFVLDEKGYKMSKSLGNVVDPLKIMNESGADILRLWTMTSDYAEDIRIGKDMIKSTGDLYRRIRNTLRFLLGALDGFTVEEHLFPECHSGLNRHSHKSGNPEPNGQMNPRLRGDDDRGSIENLPELEQLMLHHLHEMDTVVRQHIAYFDFMTLTRKLHEFCNETLSAFYFDIRKDRLYCDRPDSLKRRATRTVMAEIFNCLTAWLAPILSFTVEEAWSLRPADIFENTQSVHLREFPALPASWQNDALAKKWNTIRIVRKVVLGAIEPYRADKTIGSSLEAHPIIYVSNDIAAILEGQNVADICITSQVTVTTDQAPSDAFTLKDVEGIAVVFQKAKGKKCERSWKILPEVGSDPDYPNLTPRDADAVRWFVAKQKAA